MLIKRVKITIKAKVVIAWTVMAEKVEAIKRLSTTIVTYLIEGDGENESGNNRFGRNINKPNKCYNKVSTNKNILHGKDADEDKKGYIIKPGKTRPGGYIRPRRRIW
ncbi:unnamed protein product [Macrosiphum euphorbiae]|uniref:Uncharacterized protein n=1 Tax=Macrosiphum euphorbiae TaxID=13131 RepID=A0AAV0VPZ9_9HEMI|nr:unnamed protein product [Macrosiphum euphorbiae]